MIDSVVPHQHATGAYALRKRESFDAAAALGVPTLRDVPVDALPRLDVLSRTEAQRAHHVVTEADRRDRIDAAEGSDASVQ